MKDIVKDRREPLPVITSSAGGRGGPSDRLATDTDGTTPKPSSPANRGSHGQHQPYSAGEGHRVLENACVQRDRAGSLHYQPGSESLRSAPATTSYDTLDGSWPILATYNGELALLCERAVTAIERIASAINSIASGRPAQAETVPRGDKAYGTGEAAGLLGLNEQTVRKYCRERVFGVQATSGRWVIRHSEVERFLQGRDRIHGKGKGVT